MIFKPGVRSTVLFSEKYAVFKGVEKNPIGINLQNRNALLEIQPNQTNAMKLCKKPLHSIMHLT